MNDLTCLADGLVLPTDFEKTGINLNELVVGPTGCGKSFSNAYSRLVHTYDSSVVVPIAKRQLKDTFSKMFEKRGYKVIDLDFTHPERCKIGYDPMDYIKTDEDVIQTARNLIGGISKNQHGDIDPYWNDSATSILAAEIALMRLLAKDAGRKCSFSEVIKFHRTITLSLKGDVSQTTVDNHFHFAEKKYPGNQASALWRTVEGLAQRTASCIFSIVNNALDKIFSDAILAMTTKNERIHFPALGREKIALFVTTSPMNQTLNSFINLMYADLFRSLFETAQRRYDGRLKVPVHIICDDFACGSKILGFEEYISIFRAAGMSVTLLLQSETQLAAMYGENAATTIINNCDTYVYMGGMDIKTCQNISMRINKPLDKVMSMPLEQVFVFRRGSAPVIARRYQILEDEEYKTAINELNSR